MKSKRMTHMCVAILAFSLVVGLCPGTLIDAKGKRAVKPKLVKKVSVTKGKKKTVKIKGVKKSKIKKLKIKSSKKRIVTAKKKGKNRIVLTGKKAGKSKITVTVTYKSGKKMKKKKLKCTVTVKNPSVKRKVPVVTKTPDKKPTDVSVTQTPAPDEPSVTPTDNPVSDAEELEPTSEPVVEPSDEPVVNPTEEPTSEPTSIPTTEPTAIPEPTVPPFGLILDENGDYENDNFVVEGGVLTEYNPTDFENGMDDVVIPEGVTTIGDGAFDGVVMNSIIIPDTVVSIGDTAFQNAVIQSGELIIPGSVKTIGACAFSYMDCDRIVLSEGVETVKNAAFSNSLVEELVIASTVTYLGDKAFADCEFLQKFTYEGNPTEYYGKNLFLNDTSLQMSIVPVLSDICDHDCDGFTEITTPASCEADGTSTHICYDCSLVTGTVIDALGHNEDSEVITKEPSYTEEGEKQYVCTRCDRVMRTEVLPIISHEHVWELQDKREPTCTESGMVTDVCTLCGLTMSHDTEPLGHDFQFDHTIESTCTRTGYDYYVCTRCGRGKTEELPLKEHDWKPIQGKTPTCTEAGYSAVACTMCLMSKHTQDYPALGHSFDEISVKKDVDCTAKCPSNLYSATCTRCHYVGHNEELGPEYTHGNVHRYVPSGVSTLDAALSIVRVPFQCKDCGDDFLALYSYDNMHSIYSRICGFDGEYNGPEKDFSEVYKDEGGDCILLVQGNKCYNKAYRKFGNNVWCIVKLDEYKLSQEFAGVPVESIDVSVQDAISNEIYDAYTDMGHLMNPDVYFTFRDFSDCSIGTVAYNLARDYPIVR